MPSWVICQPTAKRNLFKEADENGFLVLNSTNDAYILVSGTPDFTFGTVDFTNPDAVEWYVGVIVQNMINYNIVWYSIVCFEALKR